MCTLCVIAHLQSSTTASHDDSMEFHDSFAIHSLQENTMTTILYKTLH